MFYCGAARLATAAATCVLPVILRCGAARLAACCLCAACRVAVGRLHVVPHCGAARVAAATAACAPPVVLPSGGCASCCAVVLPASPLPPLPARHLSCCAVVLPASPPLPARCLLCRHRAVVCRAALWCCPPCRRCLRAACHVAVGRLRVMLRCGAAHVVAATAACVLPVVLLSGGCVSCRTVVLPASPPPQPPARCLSCAIGRSCVVSRCGAACLTTAACALPAVSPSGGCVSCHAVVLPASPPPPAACALLVVLPSGGCVSCRACGAARIAAAAAACALHCCCCCCRAAHCVAVGQLRVVQRLCCCHAAAAVLVVSPSCGCHRHGGCHWVVPAHTI